MPNSLLYRFIPLTIKAKIISAFSVLILLAVLTNCADAGNIQFYGEKITVTIHDGYCTLDGEYIFNNFDDTDRKFTLFYPFALGNGLDYPDDIKVFIKDINGIKKSNPFSTAKKGIWIPVTISGNSSLLLSVGYTQKTSRGYFEYILKTTQDWGVPLQRAEYALRIPSRYHLVDLSPEMKISKRSNKYLEYYTKKTNYMPETNYIIRWEAK